MTPVVSSVTRLTLAVCNNNLDLFAASQAQALVTNVIKAYRSKQVPMVPQTNTPALPLSADRPVSNTQQNLDKKAASSAENLVTTALGILQHHGIYAMFLWLKVQDKKSKHLDVAQQAIIDLAAVIQEIDTALPVDILAGLSAADGLLTDLDRMFFVKDVLEQVLIYARYQAKAEGGDQVND